MHFIQAFVARHALFDTVPPFSRHSVVIPLRCGVSMMMEPEELDEGTEELDATRSAYGEKSSNNGAVGFVATEYWGGPGRQAGALWSKGQLILTFAFSEGIGPINEVLRHLGVSATEGGDEFDSVGLGEYRSHENWLEFARTGKARWEKKPRWQMKQ
jgi:hypothetical protein